MSIVEFEEFKGHPMIVLKNDENDRFPLKFGLGKAKKIVNNIDEIKKWVEKQEKEGKKKEAEPPANPLADKSADE